MLEDEFSLASLGKEFLDAAKTLRQAPILESNPTSVVYYLFGHAAELLLKSYLVRNGMSVDTLKTSAGHDLGRLVNLAQSQGLPKSLATVQILRMAASYKKKFFEYRPNQELEFGIVDELNLEVRRLYDAVVVKLIDDIILDN